MVEVLNAAFCMTCSLLIIIFILNPISNVHRDTSSADNHAEWELNSIRVDTTLPHHIMLVEDAIGDHTEEAYSRAGLITAL